MTDRQELFEFLYDKCREDRDLLSNILGDYVDSLSDNKLIELEDFLVNNFGDIFWMKVELTQDEIDLILYCLDQQQYEFNGNEEALHDFLNGMWFFPSNRPFVINNMFDELWSEINDMPGEIFDIPEMKDLQEDDNKSLEDFLKTNNDF